MRDRRIDCPQRRLRQNNALKFGLQVTGTLFTCAYIVQDWHYVSFWYITLCFSVLPFLFDVVVMVGIFGLKVVQWK